MEPEKDWGEMKKTKNKMTCVKKEIAKSKQRGKKFITLLSHNGSLTKRLVWDSIVWELQWRVLFESAMKTISMMQKLATYHNKEKACRDVIKQGDLSKEEFEQFIKYSPK